MPRGKTFVKDIVHERSGVKVGLYLDKKALEFSANYGEKTYTNEDGNVVEEQVQNAIKASLELEWMPCIQVTPFQSYHRDNEDKEASVGFALQRFYYAKMPGGDAKYRKSSWELQESWRDRYTKDAPKVYLSRFDSSGDFFYYEDGNSPVPFNPPCTEGGNRSHRMYFVYDEALWLALVQVQAAIAKLHDQLDLLLTDAESRAKLVEYGQSLLVGLLPAGNNPA
jgi:hypothetical protein